MNECSRTNSIVIGIVGGVASGKSFVAGQFQHLGAHLVLADELGHQVLHEASVKRQLRSRWGAEVFDREGEVDRSAVARIVFADPPAGPRERAFLEGVTHPRIGAALQRRLEALQTGSPKGSAEGCSEPPPVVVLDAALLLEAGWDRICHGIVFVEAERERRLERALARGWSEAQFASRESAQMALDMKRRRADYVIDNNRSPAEVKEQVDHLWQQLIETHDPSPAK